LFHLKSSSSQTGKKKEVSMAENTSQEEQKNVLLFAVVQGQDAGIAIEALIDEGIGVTRFASIGGFLGSKSSTLLIGVNEKMAEKAIEILDKTCRKRIAFIAVPMENSALPMPAPTPVSVGGASIFSLEVEHYEEL
jgi:uncharacterized protein YaaQ